MRRWDVLLDRHIQICETRGLAAGTIYTRRRELERFGNWLKRRKPKLRLEDVDAEQVVRYISARTKFRARSTISGVVSELRCMGELLVEEGIWRTNPLRWIRGPKIDARRRLPRRIKRKHLEGLWEAAQNRRGEHARYQAMCILTILYGTGLRRGELERLNTSDWDRDNRVLKVDGRKTGRARQLPVGDGVWRCIEAYLPRRHNHLEKTANIEEEALFVNHAGRRLNGRNVYSLFRRLAKSGEVPRVTIHQFRHTCASDLLESGVPLPEVQKFLGHAGIGSTVRYVDIADPARAAAMEKHPINRFLAAEEGRELP